MTETDHGPATVIPPESVARFMARTLQSDGGATVTLTTADWGVLVGLAMLGQKGLPPGMTVDQISGMIEAPS